MTSTSAFLSGVRGRAGTLSVCMIVKNEAALLARCLESVKTVVDEFVIVDTGSTDTTRDIIRQYGAILIEEPWRNDFAFARNCSLRAATGRWILWLDADDVVPPESLPTLRELKKETPDKIIGLIVRNQRPDNTGSEFVQARMLPNHPALNFERRIHEQIMFSADRAGLKLQHRPVIIEHHGYADPLVMKQKAGRNTALLLQEFESGHADPVLLVEIGDSYSILEDWENAAIWYRKVLEISRVKEQHPYIVSQAFLGLGTILNKKECYTEAAVQFRKSLEVAPHRPDVMFSLAVSLEKSGDPDGAITMLQKAFDEPERPMQVSIDFRQTKIKSFVRLQRLLWNQGRKEDARRSAGEAIKMNPDRAEILNAVGAMHIRDGNLLEALRTFEKSLGQNVVANIDGFIGLCVVYQRAGRKDVVATTLANMKELFGDLPRFMACELLMVERDPGKNSSDPAQTMVQGEIDYLKDLLAI